MMLTRLTRTFRIRAAITVAVAYALCAVAPSAALAFADGPSAAHCLTDSISPAHVHKQADVQTHNHADGTKHQHVKLETPDTRTAHSHGAPDEKSTAGQCCGLFCITALASELPSLPAAPVPPAMAGPGADQDLATRGPDRINRPPIV